MSREKTLVKNTAILTIGKICTQLVTFLLLPLYTSILSTEEYGVVDLLNTLVSLLLPIVTFQVEKAVFRYLIEARNENDKKTEIISTAVFSVIIQCIVYLVIFFVISPFIHNDYKIFLATNVIAYIFASLFQQIARGLGENKQFAVASFISAISTILFNILFIVFIKLGANGMLLSSMLGQIICFAYLCIVLKLYRYINVKEIKKKIISKLWKYSFPLIPNAISWWIFNASDRLIVSSILGLAQNGILSAAHKFSTVYITLYNIFDMSWIEMITVHIEDNDIEEFFNKMFNIVLRVFISMGIGIIAIMPFVYKIMINEKFYAGYYQVPIMMIGSIFNVVIGLISVIYAAKKNTKAIANTSWISALINIVVHLALIKYIGLYAASISTMIAFMTMAVYRIFDVRKKYLKIKIERKLIIQTIIICIIVLPIYYTANTLMQIVALIITILYVWLINKATLKEIIKFILGKIQGKRVVN